MDGGFTERNNAQRADGPGGREPLGVRQGLDATMPSTFDLVARSYRVTAFQDSSKPGVASQDGWCLVEADQTVRVAAIDGVTPSARTPTVEGVDGARFATRFIAEHLGDATSPAGRLLNNANQRLVEMFRGVVPADRPRACVAVVEIDQAGRLEAVLHGDCEVWIRRGSAWAQLLGGSCVDPRVDGEWQEWVDANPHATLEELQEYERRRGVPEAWVCPPIGMFDTTKPRSATLSCNAWDEVVVATDGGRLDPERLTRLAPWLAEQRSWERERIGNGTDGVRRAKPHDDRTVLRIERVTALAPQPN